MRLASILLLGLVLIATATATVRGDGPGPAAPRPNAPAAIDSARPKLDATAARLPAGLGGPDLWRSVQTVALFAVASLAPAIVLMLTSFVRIQIVLTLLRQALGSPQVPGNQILTVLALLLTALVMRPVGEVVYRRAAAPLLAGAITPAQAWEAGSRPIKMFMVDQVARTRHLHYLAELDAYASPAGGGDAPGRPTPTYWDEKPFHVIAAGFLLSELTTALTIGFLIYLPFLVVDLVVSAVLAAMGLFMLPPSLVAMPLKLILFVVADGWLLVATRLLQTFTIREMG